MSGLDPLPVVFVTGASRGIGRAVAVAFAKNGYRVGIGYNNAEKEAQETLALVKKSGSDGLLLKGDVRQSKEVNALVKMISMEWGRLDVLINNAGLSRDQTIFKMKDEEWRDVMAVNLDGAFYATRAVLPLMREKKEGCIINTASYLAKRVTVGAANYAAAKAGLLALTQATALEEGRHNIRVNAVLPGFHVTQMNENVWEKYEKEIRRQHTLKTLPDRNEFGEFVVALSKLKTVSGQVFPFESRLV